MKNSFKLLVLVLSVVLVLASFAACSDKNVVVTFDANYQDSTPTTVEVKSGEKVTEPSTITREGHNLGGWFTDPECTTAFDFGSTISADITLYAKWIAEEITVTLDLNYENSTPQEGSITKRGKLSYPDDPERANYVFGGWYTESTCENKFDINTNITSSITLYAKWTRTYVISYNWNFNNKIETEVEEEGTAIRLPSPYTRSNWEFVAWYKDADFTIECAATDVLTADTTIYAKWLQVFQVTFNANCPDASVKNVVRNVTDGQVVKPARTIQSETYDFLGWYKDADCTAGQEADLEEAITGSVTYYAKWEPKSFNVTFVHKYLVQSTYNEEEIWKSPTDVQNILLNGTATAPAVPTRAGYTFGGWYADADCTVEYDFATQITKDTRVWAKWTGGPAKVAADEQAAFELWLDEFFVNEFTGGSTINLHYTLKNPAAYGLDGQEVSIGSAAVEEEDPNEPQLVDLYCELFDFNVNLLTADQQLEYRSLKMFIETLMMSEGLDYISGYCDSISGVQNNMPINLAEYKFYSEQDVKDYLEMMTQLPQYFEEIITFEKKRVELGFGYVDSKIEEAVKQCEDFLEDQETNYLLTTFDTKVDALNEVLAEADKMSADKIAEYKETSRKNFAEDIVPAYEYLRDELNKFLGEAEVDGGMAQLFRGKDYYEFLVKYYTGTDKSIEEIIPWLGKYVAATSESAMAEVPEFLESDKPADLGFNFASSTTDLTVQPKSILNWIISNIMEGNFPKLDEEVYTNYTISFVHEALEEALSPAFYMIPAIDNYKENSIYINRGSVDQKDILGNYTTLGHEGFPGHLYQTAYYYSNIGRLLADEGAEKRWHEARIVVSCTGYVEGWTSYIEKVLYEEHTFPRDDEANTKLLKDTDIFYMVFISRFDIGINYEGWSKDDANRYFKSTLGFDNTSYVDSVYDFVIGAPGNYLKYTLGMLEFLELRDYAKEQLGDDFTLMGFHKAILDVGECQMVFVKEAVYNWIDEVKTGE